MEMKMTKRKTVLPVILLESQYKGLRKRHILNPTGSDKRE
jgi:hypothetical protein